jgi:hypothetical protein
MLDHAENDLGLLLLDEISYTPPAEGHLAGIAVVSLVIVIHYFLCFVTSIVQNVYYFSFLEFIDFNKFS